jgi:TrmH family RNA methyltransferase
MITSTSNIQVKELLRLQKKSREREKEGVFIVEGPRMAEEIPRERIVKLYVSESFQAKCVKEKNDRFIQEAEVMSDTVFAHVSDTKTPQGILAVVRRMEYTAEDILGETPHVLVLENIQDPGNLGTIFRTAEAAGATGIVLSKDCVDLYNPKVIRSTMGAIFRIPFIYTDDLKGTIDELKREGITVYAAHLKGENSYDMDGQPWCKTDFSGGCALVIGNEGNGLTEETAACADRKILIPMEGGAESLNAAVASAVLMFEAGRQRRNKRK